LIHLFRLRGYVGAKSAEISRARDTTRDASLCNSDFGGSFDRANKALFPGTVMIVVLRRHVQFLSDLVRYNRHRTSFETVTHYAPCHRRWNFLNTSDAHK
jgi:hypothetical protein